MWPNILKHDAYLLAEDAQFDEALASCQAMLATARSFGDEPRLAIFRLRIHLQRTTIVTLERVLAQGEASDQALQAFQCLLEREISQSTCLHAVRGERARIGELWKDLSSGKITVSEWSGPAPHQRTCEERINDVFPYRILWDFPGALRLMNEIVETNKRPIHERGDLARRKEILGELLKKRDRGDNGPTFALVGPALLGECDDFYSQGLMRSTLVAIACERYRLAHDNRWPVTLDLLVKEKLLVELPSDPIDNQPLRYRQKKDGIVIYSIGTDEKDDGGKIERNLHQTEGTDAGFRLWNTNRRRQPPRQE